MGFLSDFAQGALTYGVKHLEDESTKDRKIEEARALAEYKAKIDTQAELLKEQLKERREQDKEQREAQKAVQIEAAVDQEFKDKGSDVKGSDRARAQLNQAMKVGAGPGLLNSYRDAVKNAMKEERDDRTFQQRDEAEKARGDRFEAALGVRQQGVNIQQQRVGLEGQRVGIAADRAASGGSGNKADKAEKPVNLTRDIKAAADGLAMELGVAPADLNKTIGKLQNQAKYSQDAKARLEAVQPQLQELQGLRSRQAQATQGAEQPRPAPAGQPKPAEAKPAPQKPPAPAGVKQVANRADYDRLPSGTRFVAPDGTIRIKP